MLLVVGRGYLGWRRTLLDWQTQKGFPQLYRLGRNCSAHIMHIAQQYISCTIVCFEANLYINLEFFRHYTMQLPFVYVHVRYIYPAHMHECVYSRYHNSPFSVSKMLFNPKKKGNASEGKQIRIETSTHQEP